MRVTTIALLLLNLCSPLISWRYPASKLLYFQYTNKFEHKVVSYEEKRTKYQYTSATTKLYMKLLQNTKGNQLLDIETQGRIIFDELQKSSSNSKDTTSNLNINTMASSSTENNANSYMSRMLHELESIEDPTLFEKFYNEYQTTNGIYNKYNQINSDSSSNPFHLVIERTKDCLDFNQLLLIIQELASTTLGKYLLPKSQSNDVITINKRYAMIQQLLFPDGYLTNELINDLPIRPSTDQVLSLIESLDRRTDWPTRTQLVSFDDALTDIHSLHTFLDTHKHILPLYTAYKDALVVPSNVTTAFNNSFIVQDDSFSAATHTNGNTGANGNSDTNQYSNKDIQLNPVKYPVIAQYNQQIIQIQRSIQSLLQDLIHKLQNTNDLFDDDIHQIDGRYCLQVNLHSKNKYGRAIASSNSGKHFYIQPKGIITLNDQLLAAKEGDYSIIDYSCTLDNSINNKSDLRRAEGEIFAEMCLTVLKNKQQLLKIVRVVAELDILKSKSYFGYLINGNIPMVGDEGIVDCTQAKHPLLLVKSAINHHKQSLQRYEYGPRSNFGASTREGALFGKGQLLAVSAASIIKASDSIVGNSVYLKDIEKEPSTKNELINIVNNNNDINDLSDTPQDERCKIATSALIISGPNAGGKTIVLKTVGLFAYMIKYSIPVSAKPGGRVDCFHGLMADIGDMQSVYGDLSSFSAHLLHCRNMLQWCQAINDDTSTSTKNKHSLVLLDEVGTGTDPAQGAALAQAILEQFLNLRCRLIATTHYSRIKELASSDSRFRIAAMEFTPQSKPTYKLILDSIGESYALELATRLQMDRTIIDRAYSYLDSENQRLITLQQMLANEREKYINLQDDFQSKLQELVTKEEELLLEQNKLKKEIEKVQQRAVEEHIQDVKDREMYVQQLIEKANMLMEELEHATDVSREKGRIEQEEKSTVDVKKELEKIRDSLKADRVSTEKENAQQTVKNINSQLLSLSGTGEFTINDQLYTLSLIKDGEVLDAGTKLVVVDSSHSSFGEEVVISQRYRGRGRLLVRVQGLEIKMEKHLFALVQNKGGNKPGAGKSATSVGAKGRKFVTYLDTIKVKSKYAAESSGDGDKISNIVNKVIQTTTSNTGNDDKRTDKDGIDDAFKQFLHQSNNKNAVKKLIPETLDIQALQRSQQLLDVTTIKEYAQVINKISQFINHAVDERLTDVIDNATSQYELVLYILHSRNHPCKEKLRKMYFTKNNQPLMVSVDTSSDDGITAIMLDLTKL